MRRYHMFHAFLYGFILSFGLIIPLGVQNIFVFNQGAIQRHYIHAMPSVITASLCDCILIVSAVLGVSLTVFTLPWLKTVIFIIGFCFLIYMGFVTWQSKNHKMEISDKPCSAKRQIVYAASVSLFNPHAILDTVGVIGANSLHFVGSDKWAYTLACIIVSCFWFLGISFAGHYLRRIDNTGAKLQIINKLSAMIIWSVAGYFAFQLF